MKTRIFFISIFVSFILNVFITITSVSAFEITGWWKIEKKSLSMPTILRITDTKIATATYKIVDKGKNYIDIISDENVTSRIIDNGNDIITVKFNEQNTVLGKMGEMEFNYKLITHDLNLTRKEVNKLAGE